MAGVIFTIGDIFFIGLLMVTYFNQKKVSRIRSVLYRYMLWVLALLLITELISTLLVSIGHASLFTDILFRLHWSTGIIIFSFLYYYTHCFLDNLEANSLIDLIKKNDKFIWMGILFIILFIGYFFVPFNDIRSKDISYIPLWTAPYILSFCAAVVTLLVVYTIQNRKRIPTIKKVAVAIMIIELWVVFFFQLRFPHIAIIATSMSLQMFFLYFMVENPDLELIAELETTKQELEKSSHAKSDFLSNMSHEIRTPMNAIIGFSESILNQKEFNKKTTMQDIDNISVASHNLLEIINNILDISKIESGQETLVEKEYSLKKMIMDLRDITKQRLKGAPVELILDIDHDLPDRLYGDYTKLYQIILNLLTNAAKYTEVGKIIFKITGIPSLKDIKLNISIQDTGYGIKEEDRDKIFGKFNRLENATTKEIEGTGLGLVITKQYVDLMGGTIDFNSNYGVGTEFYVEITQKIIDRAPIGDLNKVEEEAKEEIDFIDCSKYKVLLVDDNILNIKVAEKLLSRYNFQIEHCTSGKDCVYKIKSGTKYDIIFMDHMMPEMDGIETLHTIQKLDMFEIPPVVALTANAITGMREMYLKEGFDDYISKPINIKELDKVVTKYFKR